MTDEQRKREAERKRRWAQANPDKVRAQQERHRARNPDLQTAKNASARRVYAERRNAALGSDPKLAQADSQSKAARVTKAAQRVTKATQDAEKLASNQATMAQVSATLAAERAQEPPRFVASWTAMNSSRAAQQQTEAEAIRAMFSST